MSEAETTEIAAGVFTTKIIDVDGEAAVEIPGFILSSLGLEEGDMLSLEVVDGGLHAVPATKADQT